MSDVGCTMVESVRSYFNVMAANGAFVGGLENPVSLSPEEKIIAVAHLLTGDHTKKVDLVWNSANRRYDVVQNRSIIGSVVPTTMWVVARKN